MRRAGLLALVLALGLLGLWPLAGPAAAGDASRCHAITDRDRRHACLAETRGRQQDCNAIRDIDNRAMCSARTSGQRSRCHIIRDAARRQACLAGMDY